MPIGAALHAGHVVTRAQCGATHCEYDAIREVLAAGACH